MKRKGRNGKGISDFVREVGDLLAPVPKTEIARLVEEANRREIPSKYLHTTYYKLRREAQGKGKTSRKQKEEAHAASTPEATAPAVEKSTRELLKDALETIHTLVDVVRSDHDRAEAEIAALRTEKRELELKLEESGKLLRTHSMREMEELASNLPDHPQILKAILEAKERIAVREKGIPKELPRESQALKMPMRYRESFLVDWIKLKKAEKRKVAKAIHLLAENGQHEPVLKSKIVKSSLPGTPHTSWWCTAFRGMQFTWTREEEKAQSVAVLICDLVRKSETHLGYKK